MAVSHWQDYLFGTTKSPRESLDKALDFAKRAVAQDDGLPEAHRTLGVLYIFNREYEKGLAEGERAVDLCPNGVETLQVHAYILLLVGRTNEAISVFEKSIRLNPKGPSTYFNSYAHALRFSGRFEDSILAFKKALLLTPNNIHVHLGLAATYSLMGREKEAQSQAKEVLKINPKFSIDYLIRILPYKDQSLAEEYYYNPLRKAGLK
jgi:tetratricopeptide (TPR) repeat protein